MRLSSPDSKKVHRFPVPYISAVSATTGAVSHRRIRSPMEQMCIRDRFAYPVREQLPVVAAAVVYRKRKLLRALPPRITVVVSDPFYPDPALPPRSARRDLHKKVYTFLCDTVSARRSYAHIEYLPACLLYTSRCV